MISNRNDPVRKEYARLAPRYDRRWSFYVDATIHETLRRLDVRPGECVLDVGCGTGILIHEISSRNPTVRLAGVDPSSEMLAIARGRVDPSVKLEEAWAHELPYPPTTFDVVVSTNAFHYFRDPHSALMEMRRVLKPGGRLLITDWCDEYLSCKVFDFVLRRINQAHRRVYGRSQCRTLLENAGFEDIDIQRYRIDWLWGMMTARAKKAPEQANF